MGIIESGAAWPSEGSDTIGLDCVNPTKAKTTTDIAAQLIALLFNANTNEGILR